MRERDRPSAKEELMYLDCTWKLGRSSPMLGRRGRPCWKAHRARARAARAQSLRLAPIRPGFRRPVALRTPPPWLPSSCDFFSSSSSCVGGERKKEEEEFLRVQEVEWRVTTSCCSPWVFPIGLRAFPLPPPRSDGRRREVWSDGCTRLRMVRPLNVLDPCRG